MVLLSLSICGAGEQQKAQYNNKSKINIYTLIEQSEKKKDRFFLIMSLDTKITPSTQSITAPFFSQVLPERGFFFFSILWIGCRPKLFFREEHKAPKKPSFIGLKLKPSHVSPKFYFSGWEFLKRIKGKRETLKNFFFFPLKTAKFFYS